jgi:2-polyprenyl-6-methoxyphenol hydroxylase-like FAD-dependent oxidoreductase
MEKQAKRDDAAPAMTVLVSGASFAGLATAYLLNRLGHAVTVVEIGKHLKKGGTPVDIRDETIDIVKGMGLFDVIKARSLPARPTEFKSADDLTQAVTLPQTSPDGEPVDGYEIDRDVLLEILFTKVDGEVEFLFDNSIDRLVNTDDGVSVSFADGSQRRFSLVAGCEGNHSAIRKMCFGPEAEFSSFMGLYFSICIVDKLVIEPNTTQIYNEPGKTVMLNSYEDKTDIVLCFHSDREIPYDYRDVAAQRNIVLKAFLDVGWRVPALLKEVEGADNFYFDKMAQIKMPSWAKGGVVLVGDAAYCASPAAGMGGSLAIVGASALADAIQRYPEDLPSAFEEYEAKLRPFIAEVQARAVQFGKEIFVLRTEEAIRTRNDLLAALQEPLGWPRDMG